MGKIEAVLARLQGRWIYLETNIVVYFLERHEQYLDLVLPFFQLFYQGLSIAYTGDAAVAGTLYKTYRSDSFLLVNGFKTFFGDEEFTTVLPRTTKVFELTTEIAPKQKMIDALHCSTAIMAGCQFLPTNDTGFKSNAKLEVTQLRELVQNNQ